MRSCTCPGLARNVLHNHPPHHVQGGHGPAGVRDQVLGGQGSSPSEGSFCPLPGLDLERQPVPHQEVMIPMDSWITHGLRMTLWISSPAGAHTHLVAHSLQALLPHLLSTPKGCYVKKTQPQAAYRIPAQTKEPLISDSTEPCAVMEAHGRQEHASLEGRSLAAWACPFSPL